jgi:hypothetical protein
MYALKSSEARRQYPRRLKLFFDYVGLRGTLNEQEIEFLKRLKEDISQQDNLLRFLTFTRRELDERNLLRVPTTLNIVSADLAFLSLKASKDSMKICLTFLCFLFLLVVETKVLSIGTIFCLFITGTFSLFLGASSF